MARTVGKPAASIPVTATRHAKDQRVNIPTAELEAFAEDEEKRPETLLYPRDPSLDPQLVWKGKDEQDRQDLAVPAVPDLHPGADRAPGDHRGPARPRRPPAATPSSTSSATSTASPSRSASTSTTTPCTGRTA